MLSQVRAVHFITQLDRGRPLSALPLSARARKARTCSIVWTMAEDAPTEEVRPRLQTTCCLSAIHLTAVPSLACSALSIPDCFICSDPLECSCHSIDWACTSALGSSLLCGHKRQHVTLGLWQELERQVQEALSCPCVDHIKSGPCGTSFVQAFSCYLKGQARPEASVLLQVQHLACCSTHPDSWLPGQGAGDCLQEYRAMQTCMSKHPAAFADLAETLEQVAEHTATDQ